MPGTRPTKKQLAEMKVANELGVTPTAIARQMTHPSMERAK